jgi:hypothetical protein
MRYNWAEIERGIGLRLPADYKLLAESLPSGWVRGFARLRKPERPQTGPQRLDDFGMRQLETLRAWRAEGQGRFPYPLYPEPGGLLPWGAIVAGGYAFWLTEPAGDPDGWPVVIASQDCDVWARFGGPVAAFLVEVAAARYDPGGFTEGPVQVVFDESGEHKTAQPVILAERPVFERDQPPPPPPQPHRVPDADFWLVLRQGLGDRRPVNELAGLREVIGDPPAGAPEVDWAAVHARLGFELPSDYRGFIDAYGPGTLDYIRIMAPGVPGEMDLFALLERTYAQVRDRDRTDSPPFYPEPGGTVCWGETADGWACGWAPVSADPDEWEVVAVMPGRGHMISDGLSFSTALRQYAGRDPLALIRQRVLPKRPVTFTPYRPA